MSQDSRAAAQTAAMLNVVHKTVRSKVGIAVLAVGVALIIPSAIGISQYLTYADKFIRTETARALYGTQIALLVVGALGVLFGGLVVGLHLT